MTESPTSSESAPPPSPIGAEPWTAAIAWALLDTPARDDLAVLFRFVAAARAVADHPALSIERKEAALAALASPFDATAAAGTADAAWTAPAQALADLLARRGIDSRAAWQILQAAGQDLRKTRYRDWSDLLMWCRFSAAPVGALALHILDGDATATKAAESLALAVQMTEIVRRAPSHYRWLGRVYLPERWFAEARGEMADLGFQRMSPPLRVVLGRALEQGRALMDDARDLARAFPQWRRRAAIAALRLELRAEWAALARSPSPGLATAPGSLASRVIRLRALWSAVTGRA